MKTRLLTYAALPLMMLGLCTSALAASPDLTSGGLPSDTANINLGSTGMEGWIYNDGAGKFQETVDSRQILVTAVDAGSPADGILAKGDVILGADGTGVNPVNFTSDARKALAYAIANAEGNNPGVLKLLRWRSGVTSTVSITLESMGFYSATAPYNCPKSTAILEKGIEYIMNNVTDTGYAGFGPTVLMAANDPSNPKNAVRQARAQTEAYQLNLSQADIDDMTSGDLSRSIGKPWNIGPSLITQAEYYLQTGDSAVLSSIRARAIMIANAQSLFGTMGHHYSLPGPNGEVNSAYGIGYGPVNNAGMPCFLGLILAEKCGFTDQEIVDGIARATKYFSYYEDLGAVPYGENKETGSISNNGKSGLAALTLSMVNGEESASKYFAKLSTFGADERDSGHTGPYFNQLWTPLGSNLGGEDSLAHYFNTTSWLYDLARRWDGDFVYQPYYQSGGIKKDYGQGHKASWTTLLTYATPLAQLYITGKNANPSVAFDVSDIAAIDHAIGYDPSTRTTAELIEDLKSPLPQLHWSAGSEIGDNRSADHASILPTIIDMAQNGATYAEQHGAIFALGKIADDSTASVLAGFCADPNSKVRYMAANALSNLSMAAKTAEVANIVNGLVANDRPMLPLDPENPMHVEKMSFANLLFDSNDGIWGGSRVTTADRNLFYPAFRIIATAPMGVTCRDKAFSVAPYLTKADVEELADVMVEVVSGPPPAEISYGCRAGAIEAMQINNFAEGVPAAVIAFFDMTKNNELVLQQLENYGASSLTVRPDPEIVEFCKRLFSSEDPYFFGTHFDVEAQAILDAIASDPLPVELTPFKSVDWIFADQASLTLPATSTVLRVQWTDLAKGTPVFTWRKVHGAGEVSFAPNGTAAAENTAVVFDGTPGVYTFEVTMSDDKGLTEAYGTVTVTLNNTGGSLPPNTSPTANSDSITAGQGAPTQLVLTGSDPEGQELIYTVTEKPANGYLTGTAPNLVYTSDLAYTGADSITFEVMDTEGLVSGTATVNITVNPVADVGLAIYEPFDYPFGSFNGSSSVNEIGLEGSWTAQSNMDVLGGSLNYGSLVTNGGALTASDSANSHAASRAINSAALAGNGLLDDGSTLWFSAILGHPGMISDMYLALANDQFANAADNHYIVDDGAQLGAGMGVWLDGSDVYAAHFQDVAQGGANVGASSGDHGKIKSGVQRLVVGKITWGAASDKLEVYLPWDDLKLPSAPSSSVTVNVDQSTFDTLTISRNGTPLIDEIRFGSTYQSVLQGTSAMVVDTAAPTPDPMTFAVAPAPSSPSSITMTATPAFDLNEVEYSFTCTGGGGNDSGWQDSNVYTDTGLTAGVQYSYTVKARDKQPWLNETVTSSVASATIPTVATVPNMVGILQASAEDLLVAADLSVGTITQASAYSLTVPAGHVLSQSPAGDSSAAYGSAVDLEISIGQDPALPTMAGVDIVDDQNGGPVVVTTPMTFTLTFGEDMDAATLDAADFANVGTAAVTIGTITETSPGVVTVGVTPTGTGILRFAIAEGATIQDAQGDSLNTTTATIDDTVITINLSDEIVPDVTGLAQATAESNIVAANLLVGTVNSIYDEVVPVGDVISQNPVGGSSIPGQSSINLVVSLGTPPDTTGPVIVSHVPVDGDYNVEADAELQITFDEEVFIGTGNIVLRNLNDGTDMIIPVTDSAQALAYFNTLTITPTANLDAGKSYAVRVPAGAVVDASGNGFLGINNDYTWNFSTALTSLSSVLLTEDFEAPDVTAYSEGTSPANWVRATFGFGATQHGLTDKAGGDFTALDPNYQAYAFRYSNSGLTTAESVIGTIAEGETYRVEFDVIRDDGKNAGTPYDVRMWAFSPGDARTDFTATSDGSLLTNTTGNATADGNFSTVFFEYTVPVGSPDVGKDFAVRLKGASTSAIIDNVVVRTVSPGSSDQVAPAIALLTPGDDAQNVSLVDNLKIIFDEDIAVGAGLITIKDLTTGVVTVINAIDGSQVLLTGDTLQINPTEDFNSNTFYSVQIESGVIADLAGNGFAGITDDISWSFNTGETTDGTAPGIFALSPADEATGVSYSTSLTLTMDENVVVNAGNITLKNLTDATQTVIDVTDPSQVAAAGPDVIITPASYMSEGKDYAVQMDAGTILDLSGNAFAGIADDVIWNFTTSANNPPAIASLDPADEAVNVDIATNLSVTFDEDIAAGTGNITIRNVNTASDTLIDINDATQVTITGPTLTINPTADLAEIENFAILIDSGAVQDLAGNSFAGITSESTWNLATGVDLTGLAFSEDFEVSSGSPDVTALDSAGNTSKQTGLNWVRASQGFGANDHGIVDESSGQFTDPGGEQAYAFRFVNCGITTAKGVVGTLAAGMLHKVSFSVVVDGYNYGDAYNVGLVTFAPGASRDDCTGMANGTSMVLATASGTYSSAAYQTLSFEYISDGVSDATVQGQDLAIRMNGAGSSANIDNIQITIVDAPPTLASSDIVDDQAGAPVLENTTVNYTLTFSEDMDASTVDVSDFGNAGTSNVTIDSVVETATPGVFTVAVTPTNPGTLQLQVNADSILTDTAGSALDTDSAILDDATITVEIDNFEPVANNQNVVTDEDVAVAVTLTASDVDPGDTLTYSVVTGPTNGTLSGTEPNLTYTPNSNFYGTDEFTFRAYDGREYSNVATVSISVNAVNDAAPVANHASVTTIEDTSVALVLTASDVDLEDALTYSVVAGPTNGTLNGTAPNLIYTPNADFNGSDEFTFKVNDGSLDSNTAKVNVSVLAVNDAAPVANDGSATVEKDKSVAITLTASDVDPEDSLTYSVVTAPANGTLSGTAPNLTYTPNAAYIGSDVFTFKANDGMADSNIATVSITVSEAFSSGTVFADNFEAGVNLFGGTTQDVASYNLNNTSKVTNAALWVRSSDGYGSDRNGLIDEIENGGLNFTDPTGEQAYGFRYSNSGVTTAEGLLGALTVGKTIDISFDVVMDGHNGGTIYDASLLLFDPGATRSSLSGSSHLNDSAAVLARVTGDASGDGSYTTVTFSYVVGDPVDDNNGEGGGVDTAWLASLLGKDMALRFEGATTCANIDNVEVSITSNGGEDTTPPTLASADIVDDTLGGPISDTSVTYTITFSEDMDDATVDVTDFGNSGTASLTVDSVAETTAGVFSVVVTPTSAGSLQLQLNAGSMLKDASGNALDTTTAIMDDTTIMVDEAVNSVPVADNQSVTTDTDIAVAVNLTGSDADLGDTLTYSVVTGPSNGTLSGTEPNLTYTPNGNFNGTDEFTFKINDGSVDSNIATVSITVNVPVNTAPVASSDSVVTEQDIAVSVTLVASDADGDELFWNVGAATHGVLSGTAPNLTYTPNPGFEGSDSFVFKVNDGAADSNVATVSLTVFVPVNNAPVASNDSVVTDEDVAVAITLVASDADGDDLAWNVGTPTSGVLSGTAPNLTYTPNAGFSGNDSFTFSVNDGDLDSNVATVSVTVIAAPNNAPVASDGSVVTQENTALAVTLVANDPDNDELTWNVSTPTSGVLSGTAPNLIYTPNADFIGSDSFTFSVDDNETTSNVATVSITVKTFNYGQLIMEEGFESPVVSGYVENTVPNNGMWVGSTEGFGATYRGLSNETVAWPAVAPFTTPYGDQGYKINSGNAGLTTAQNVLGETLEQGVHYTVKFNVATEAGAGDANYEVQLVAFETTDTDTDRAKLVGVGVGTVLATTSGTVSTTDMSHRDELSFTAFSGDPSIGKELGIRLMNDGTGSETFDHIVFFKGHDMHPSPEIGFDHPGGNVPLSWTNFSANSGTDVWVDVWFGTDPLALTKVVDAGLNATTTTVNVSSAGTYYWRVDSYLNGSTGVSPLSGDLFYFTVTDGDADGLPDDYELAHTDPASATALNPADDLEGDGLTNADEYYYGTDPNSSDTDGDTLIDGAELSGVDLRPATSPVSADTDNDGLSDNVETNTGSWVSASDTGTNPVDADWDQDGLVDGAETNTGTLIDRFDTGTNPFVADTDADGAGDYYEVVASNTNPISAANKPSVPYPLPDPDGSTGATNKPIKVYIMAGQSNMVGIGYTGDVDSPGSLEAITKVDHKFPNLIDASNNWTQRQDVMYRGVVSATAAGPLTAGQGADSTRVGPELGFGHVMGYYHDEPVLLLKASQGNRSLAWDFCPPSVIADWDFTDGNTYAGYGNNPAEWATGSTPVPSWNWYAGKQYDECFRDESAMGTKLAWLSGNTFEANWLVKHNGVMYECNATHTADTSTEPGVGASWSTVWSLYSIENTADVLANFATYYPQWAAQGYEIAGFVWWQGHKDGGEAGTDTAGAYASKYEDNLVELINSLRAEFNAPSAPFVVATIGFGGGGWNPGSSGDTIYNAQLAVGDPAQYPVFGGNVKSVDTTGYWRSTSESPGVQGFHYNNNAETYTLVGDAMGRAMIDLVSVSSPDTTPPTLASGDIVDDAAGGPVQVNNTVSYTVTFNENMDAATVDVTDFGNAGTSSVTFDSVTETGVGVFTVAVTPTNIGSLQLQVNSGAVLQDVAGNSLDTTAAILADTTITVDNGAPVANDDTAVTNEDNGVAITLLANDPESEPLTYTVVTGPTNGSLSGTAPNLTYTPNGDYNGTDSFTFKATDTLPQDSNIATVSITVNAVNDAPVASNDLATTNEDTGVAVTLTASDVDSGSLAYTVVSGPTNGVLSGTAPNLTYTPNANTNGGDSFTFKVNDGLLDSNTATISLTINPVDDAPVAGNQSVTTDEDIAVAVTLGATDVDGEPLTYNVVSGPTNGVLSGTAPNLTYTPNADANGSDSFTFTATGNAVTSNTATISITVNAINDAPVFTADPITGADATEDAAYSSTVAGSATDDDGDALTYAKVSGPAWLSVAANGDLTGTPTNDEVGANAFTVSVSDGTALPVEATLNITVINVNDAPVFVADPINGSDATVDALYASTIAASASDVDTGDTLTYAKVSGPAWLSVAPNGALSGTPTNSDVGANVFTVSVSDGTALPVEATLNITVTNTNNAPVFAADPINGSDATEDAVYASTIAGSASDDDSDPLTYAKVSGPAWLSVAPDGTLSGTPTNAEVGANVFTVSVSDGTAAAVNATLNITVTNVNDAPIFAADPINGSDATEDEVYASTIAGSASDDDSDPLTYAKVSGPAWLTVAIDGTLSGTPDNSDVGANSFTVSVSDATAAPVQATLNITVDAAGSSVVVFSDDFEVVSGSPDVDASGSTGNTSKQTGPDWVRTTNGFGANNHGIVDESSGQFTDPAGEQAYAFRYTNSGITTAEGAIGALAAGSTYTVSFDVVLDGHNSGDAYTVGLVTFAPGAVRTDMTSLDGGTSMVLASAANSFSGTTYQTVTFEYTSDGVTDAAVLGHDLAVRLKGASTSATIDNVEVRVGGGAGGGDTTPPTLASSDIVDDQAGGPVVENTTITYTMTFNEDMDNATVDATDFSNAGSSSVTFGTITETSPGVFTVQATPTNAGTLQLQVSAGASLSDAAGNALDTTTAIADDTVITVNMANVAPTWASNPVNEANATEDSAYIATLADDSSDVNSDPLTFTKVSGPAWLTVDTDGTLSGTPINTNVGANVFTVSVTDGITAPVQATLNIEVINTNDAPVFASDPINGSDATEDVAYADTIAGSATDDDGDALTYAKVSGPAWLSVAANGDLTGTPTNADVGANAFTISVSDGIAVAVNATLNITVINTNDAPVFAADPINGSDATEDTLYAATIAGSASDDDSDPLTYAKVSGPAWLSVASDGTLSGTPDNAEVGANVFTVSVSDGIAVAVNATLNITVTNVNDAPIFAADPINGSDATEDEVYASTIAGSASDDDSDPLTYAKVSGPAWLSVAPDGTLSGTPTNAEVGANVFTVSVSDGTAAAVNATLNITVTNVNDAPIFAADPINGSDATEDAVYASTIAGSASDDDSDPLTYAKVSGPAWLSVAPDGTLSGTPDNAEVGANVFTVSVSDSIAVAVNATLNITVTNTNDAPVFAADPINGSDATEDAVYASTIAGSASDDDSDPLTYAKVSGPAWLSVAPDGTLSGTPENAEVGANVFTVSVSDGIAVAVNATLSITVTNVNDAPIFAADPINASDATEGALYTSTIAGSASDADSDPLTYAKVSGSAWLSVAPDGTLSGTPDNADVGANVFTVTVSDGTAVAVNATLNITVTNTNDAPVFAADPINGSDATEDTLYAATIAGSASDDDSDPLTYAKVSGPVWLSVAPDGTLSGTPTNSDVGLNSFTVSVSDSIAPAVQATLNITVDATTTLVPDVVGLLQATAESNLLAASLTVGTVTTEYSATVPDGDVISQGLTPGSSVAIDSAVDLVVSLGVDLSPKLVRTTVNSVSNTSWTTVDLGQTYNSAVIIATPIYPTASLPPVVTRITNITSSGFDLKIDRADGLTDPVNIDVSIVAIDEGVYTQAVDGVTMEAVKFTSTVTARKSSWGAEARSFQNSYTNPVVVGQVMSANDPNWSVFWSMGSSSKNPVDASNLNVGKHVAEDSNTTRADEVIGYIVIESGSGTVNGVAYEAALGGDTVRGFGTSPTPYTYSLSGGLTSASTAAASVSGMDGNDGSWAVLSGSPALTTTSIGLHACEDQIGDSEQSHTTTQVGYIVFE